MLDPPNPINPFFFIDIVSNSTNLRLFVESLCGFTNMPAINDAIELFTVLTSEEKEAADTLFGIARTLFLQTSDTRTPQCNSYFDQIRFLIKKWYSYDQPTRNKASSALHSFISMLYGAGKETKSS